MKRLWLSYEEENLPTAYVQVDVEALTLRPDDAAMRFLSPALAALKVHLESAARHRHQFQADGSGFCGFEECGLHARHPVHI